MSTPDITAVVSCVGCGGRVPDIDGPTHDYMRASPGCWQLYGEVAASTLASPVTSRYHVDCYAAQHPGGAEHDRRQRQSVAVHLTSLCLLLEHRMPARKVSTLRGRMSQTVLPHLRLSDWPYLTPPRTLGTVTVADVNVSGDQSAYQLTIERWAGTVWTAWTEHHGTIRRWALAAIGGLV